MSYLTKVADIARFLGIKNPYLLKESILGKKYWIRNEEEKKDLLSFEKYISNSEYIRKLKEGLDDVSNKTIDYILDRINVGIHNTYYDYKFMIETDDLYPEQKKVIDKAKEEIKLPLNIYYQSVFYYKHGIDLIPNIKDKIKGKDIIDCGSFIGDSAAMFAKNLDYNKIFCLEPIKKHQEYIKEMIKLNVFKNIELVGKGISDRKGEFYMENNLGGSRLVNKKGEKLEKIEIDTLDNIIRENNIKPGIIKWDIEGEEYNSILGGIESIKKYKPILLISIYHNGRDFFEIKPLIEGLALGYRFMIRKFEDTRYLAETMLICY